MIDVDIKRGIAISVHWVLAPCATWRLPKVAPWRFEHASTWANNVHASELAVASINGTLELFPFRNVGLLKDGAWFGGRFLRVLLDKLLGFRSKGEVCKENTATAR
jgi:hypothetical protein